MTLWCPAHSWIALSNSLQRTNFNQHKLVQCSLLFPLSLLRVILKFFFLHVQSKEQTYKLFSEVLSFKFLICMCTENKPKGCFASGRLYLRTFFVPSDVLSLRTFGLPDVLSLWTFCPSGCFVSMDILSHRRYVSRPLCLRAVIVRYHDDGSKNLNACILLLSHMVYL
jgi:hypothetical protein